MNPNKDSQVTDSNDQELSWLDQLNQLLLDNISTYSLSNDWLAQQLNISVRTFYRKVSERTGLSPTHYIRAVRMQKAMELLESGDYTNVKQVTAAVGFKKSTYFSQLFKEAFGKNPIEVLNKKWN